ncbi:MAG: hypothetical protein WD934_07255 [Gemmatimonadales bacterium]
MAPPFQEDALEDAPPERRQSLGQRRKTAAAVAVAEPVNREVADDRDQPGAEAGPVDRGVGVAAEAAEVVFPQGFADPREDFHHIIVVLDVVLDCRENDAAVPGQEQIPRGFRPVPLQFGQPFVHGPPWKDAIQLAPPGSGPQERGRQIAPSGCSSSLLKTNQRATSARLRKLGVEVLPVA